MEKDIESRLQSLERLASRLSPREVRVTGTTSSTANTASPITHSLGKRPDRYALVYGDVYVFDLNEKYVDIRSTQTSQRYEIILS